MSSRLSGILSCICVSFWTIQRVVPSHIPRPEYADHPQGSAHSLSLALFFLLFFFCWSRSHLSLSSLRSSGSANAEKRAKAQHHIEVKTAKQIEGMRAASKIAKEVLDIGAAAVKVFLHSTHRNIQHTTYNYT